MYPGHYDDTAWRQQQLSVEFVSLTRRINENYSQTKLLFALSLNWNRSVVSAV